MVESLILLEAMKSLSRVNHHLVWGVTVACVFFLVVFGCIKLLPPKERVTLILVQKPWMTLNFIKGQGIPVPFSDKDDSNILYLIFLRGDGRAIKIHLDTQAVLPIQFHDEGPEATRIAQYEIGAPHLFNVTPLKWQFQGSVENRDVYHLFGFPWPSAPMTRKAQLRSGDWRLMDIRDGEWMELLRFRVRNSERKDSEFGDLHISLGSKWVVLIDPDISSKIYLFRRDLKNKENRASS